MEYKAVIGLEIHSELKTQSKMFCDCLNNPEEEIPNTNICPVCLAHPGTLPVINKKALEQVILVGLSLNSEIPEYSKFDRKNYNLLQRFFINNRKCSWMRSTCWTNISISNLFFWII